jgi:hypothetical protein
MPIRCIVPSDSSLGQTILFEAIEQSIGWQGPTPVAQLSSRQERQREPFAEGIQAKVVSVDFEKSVARLNRIASQRVDGAR